MSRKIIYGILTLALLSSCGGQKELAKNTTVSSKDYPYIETFHKAVRLKSTGRINEAIEKFEKCLSMRQDDDAVYYALSGLELLRNNEDASAEYILKAAEIDPDNLWYTQELAYMYLNRKKYSESIEKFNVLIKQEPQNVDWLYGLAQAYLENGNVDKCIATMNLVEEEVGLNPQLSMHKYSILSENGKTDEAIKELEVAFEQFPKDPELIATMVDYYYKIGDKDKAANMLEELVIADPENGRAQLALADLYRKEGDQTKSYVALKKAFLADDVDIDTKMEILIKIHETSPEIDREVYELVDIMLEQYPNNAKSHSIHGDYLLTEKKDEEALAAYRKALEYDDNQYPIWNQVMIMEYQSGEHEMLYTDSKACLELFPTISLVYLLNGVSANQTMRYAEAEESLLVGKELVFNDNALKAEFLGQLGESSFGQGQTTQGKEYYKKALETDPGSLLIKNNYALRLAKSNIDLDVAESLIKQVMAVTAGQPEFLDTYGFILFQKGEFDKAKAQFEAAYSFDTNDPRVMEHLGDTYFKLNDVEKALSWWERAKAIKVNDLLNDKIKDKKYYAPKF